MNRPVPFLCPINFIHVMHLFILLSRSKRLGAIEYFQDGGRVENKWLQRY